MDTTKNFLRSDINSLRQQLATRKHQLITLASEEQGFKWEPITERSGILHDPQQRNNWQQVGYLGFSTKRKAEQCAKTLRKQNLATNLEIRKARRLTTCNWEVKAIDIDPDMLRSLASTEKAA